MSLQGRYPGNRLPNFKDTSSSDDRCRRRWDVLRPFMREAAVGVELGVFKGNFVDYLLATKPRKLYLVDPWYRLESGWEWAAGDKSPTNALTAILAAFRDEIERGQVEPRVQFSVEFLTAMQDDSLDWIYIDSNHTYKTTVIELTHSLRKVNANGYIMGDDYIADPEHKNHGVYKAVKEFEASNRLELVVDGTYRQFVARRK